MELIPGCHPGVYSTEGFIQSYSEFRPVKMSVTDIKWSLIQWPDLRLQIVETSSVTKETRLLRDGKSMVEVNVDGQTKTAKLIGRSDYRSVLKRVIGYMDLLQLKHAGPNYSPSSDGEPPVFSPSSESWVPSDHSIESADEEKENKKPLKPRHIKRELNGHREQDTPTNFKGVLKHSNKVNLPNGPKKHTININCNSTTSKRKLDETESNTGTETPENPAKKPKKKSKSIFLNIEIEIDEVGCHSSVFKGISVVTQKLYEEFENNENDGKDTVINVLINNSPNCPEMNIIDNTDDSNHSDDPILISNKYSKIDDDKHDSHNVSDRKYNKKNDEEIREKSNTHVQDFSEETSSNESTSGGSVARHSGESNYDDGEWIPIGSGKTMIRKDKYMKIKWSTYQVATRGLLSAVFSREVLASHSLTGKPSPAFQNKPRKKCLDTQKVTDIVDNITTRFGVTETAVRSVITTKCADESKMHRQELKKRQSEPINNQGDNKTASSPDENTPPKSLPEEGTTPKNIRGAY